jgi:hypothetical protein
LNAVGTRAWELIGPTGTTREKVIDALLAEFEVSRDILERDLDALLTALEQRRLVQITP